jgi:16S rRNA (cytosine1402-N4)-methyltransferase
MIYPYINNMSDNLRNQARGLIDAVKSTVFLAEWNKEQGTALSPLLRTMIRALVQIASARPLPLFAGFDHYSSENVIFSSKVLFQKKSFSSDPSISFQKSTDFERPYHIPVLPTEVSEWMAVKPGDVIVDGTLGGGGHTEAFLENGAQVIGIDRDPDAIAFASERLVKFENKFSAHQLNYSQLLEIPELAEGGQADGILLDLGVSSHQLDCAERGFSFQKDGPLDMRMGPNATKTAADFVNNSSEQEIISALREYGEEPQARRIAQLITMRRQEKPFSTTLDLASHIENKIGRSGRTHPATRTFQAIRMTINEELSLLAEALQNCIHCLKPNGRLLVITFHSLEDRMVKKFMQYRAKEYLDDPTWSEPRINKEHYFTLPSRKSISANKEELSKNPRARSAKLRIAIRNQTPIATL